MEVYPHLKNQHHSLIQSWIQYWELLLTCPGVPDQTHMNGLTQIDVVITTKKNLITQVILEKLTHYLPHFGHVQTSRHTWPCLVGMTEKIYCFINVKLYEKISTSYLHSFLQLRGFWTRTQKNPKKSNRFFFAMWFLQKVFLLTAIWLPHGHYRRGSLTHPMLITVLYIFHPKVNGRLVRLGP